MERKFFDRAVEIALQVDPHKVAPNPRVGCVIVHQGAIVAEGVHEVFGGPHAEVNAIKALPEGIDIGECDVYVTLEPCGDHPRKKTPSCTQMLLEKRPRAVYCGMLDITWKGAAIERFRAAGINAEYVPHEGCERVNPFFEYFLEHKKPYVTLKMALSLDGRITNPHGGWVSGEASRRRVHMMRAAYSAVLTTPATVKLDNPRLTTRLDGWERTMSDPAVVVAGTSDIARDARLFEADRVVLEYWDQSIDGLMRFCAENRIDSVFTECGARMCGALLEANVVDEIVLFFPAKVYGGGTAAFDKYFLLDEFVLFSVDVLGNDVCVVYKKKT